MRNHFWITFYYHSININITSHMSDINFQNFNIFCAHCVAAILFGKTVYIFRWKIRLFWHFLTFLDPAILSIWSVYEPYHFDIDFQILPQKGDYAPLTFTIVPNLSSDHVTYIQCWKDVQSTSVIPTIFYLKLTARWTENTRKGCSLSWTFAFWNKLCGPLRFRDSGWCQYSFDVKTS